jgi:polyketide biosynthesis enoyl-CoA hydratase PksI
MSAAAEAVVETIELEPGIVQISMCDRERKNTFSPALIEGLVGAFDGIARRDNAKVVILTGYDSYFCSGGTQESLLALHAGKAKFTDVNLYGLALDCRVPVIAAMQGHGIGGGFVMGLYADLVLLSRESIYTTNFMNYGFTPGMGATLIVPQKLGLPLAEEMLFTARNYRGEELKQRGIPFSVLPRAEVLAEALALARQLAEKPRGALIELKNRLAASLRERLPEVIAQELAMHDRTFHGAEVKDRIQARFGK